MPNYKKAFPSKFLKAEDISTLQAVEIKRVAFETVGAGQDQKSKLVAHFVGLDKGLVLNLINADTMAEICGTDNYEAWPGHTIALFPTKTEYQGKRVACLRICEPPRRPAASETRPEPVPKWVTEPEQGGSEQAGRARDIDEALGSPVK